MGLFKRKKKESPPADPLALLADGIASALAAAMPTASIRASLKTLDHEACRSWLAGQPSLCLSLYRSSASPCAGFFLPSGFFGGADEDAAAEAFGLAWAASLPPPYREAVAAALPTAPEERDASLWPFLEMESFSLDAGGTPGWLFIEPDLRAALARLGEDGAETAQSGDGAAIVIPRPRLFPALDPFSPPSFALGKRSFQSSCESFALLPGDRVLEEARRVVGAEEPVWYFAGFELQGSAGEPARKLSFVYAFDFRSMKARSSGAEPDKVEDALAFALFQAGLRDFSRTANRAVSSQTLRRIPSPPEFPKAGSVLLARASLLGSGARAPFALAAPAGALLPLLQSRLDPASIKRGQRDPKILVLKLSSRLLPSRLGAALSPPELRAIAPRMLVSELLNLLSDGDYDLVLQNCLVATLGAKALPALFYGTEKAAGADGTAREFASRLGPFDPVRFLARLPQALREDFALDAERLSGNPRELCLERNLKAMDGIAAAVSQGRIAASPRLAWLLKEFWQKPARAEAEKELAKLKAADVPFASLEALPQRLAQKALARVDDRVAALALLDGPERKDSLHTLVSKARMGRLDEELSYLKRGYDSGGLEPAELAASKRSIAAACEEVRLEEEKEERAALERARGKRTEPSPSGPRGGRR